LEKNNKLFKSDYQSYSKNISKNEHILDPIHSKITYFPYQSIDMFFKGMY